MRDVLANRAKSLFHRNSQFSITNSQLTEDFWALKDVSIDIKQGEIVGIIGRNGVDKSRLLKVLSNISEPPTAASPPKAAAPVGWKCAAVINIGERPWAALNNPIPVIIQVEKLWQKRPWT